jgi:uncharacterized membrane protein
MTSKQSFLTPIHWILFISTCILVAFLINYGSFNFIQESTFGHAYDSLAKSLLKFDVTVEEWAISVEKFVKDGRVFMYYGPFPALLRIPQLILFPETSGLLSNLYRFIAFVIGFFFAIATTFYVLEKNTELKEDDKAGYLTISILGIGLASPLTSLLTLNHLFYEAITISLALSLVSTYFLVKELYSDEAFIGENLLYISILTGLNLLTRIAFSVPFILILLFLLFQKFSFKKMIMALSPFLVCLSFQLWYNKKRFDSYFKFADYKYYGKWVEKKESDPEFYKNKSSIKLVSFDRIANNYKYYFVLNTKLYKNEFPYLIVKHPPVGKLIKEYKYESAGPIFPFPQIYTWLFLLGLMGIIFSISTKSKFKYLLIFFFIQAINILMFKATLQRYQAEFMPLFFFGFLGLLSILKTNSLCLGYRLVAIIITLISALTTCLYALAFKAESFFYDPGEGQIKAQKLISNIKNSSIITKSKIKERP